MVHKFTIMKRFICLLTLIFALVLLNTNCTKPTDDNKTSIAKTLKLSDKYSDWINLTWVSTDGDSSIYKYPKLEIKIINDTVVHVIETPFDTTFSYDNTFLRIGINSGIITFSDPIIITTPNEIVGNLSCTINSFDKNGKIIISSNWFVDKTATQYNFVLQKN
jgi:hypothetical protein